MALGPGAAWRRRGLDLGAAALPLPPRSAVLKPHLEQRGGSNSGSGLTKTVSRFYYYSVIDNID